MPNVIDWFLLDDGDSLQIYAPESVEFSWLLLALVRDSDGVRDRLRYESVGWPENVTPYQLVPAYLYHEVRALCLECFGPTPLPC